MTNQNIFVTGATGLVGAGLAIHFLRRGHIVYALCRGGDPTRVERALASLDPREQWRAGTLHVVPGDITQDDIGLPRKWYEGLRRGIDVVMHAAGHIKFEDEDPLNMEVNFLGTRRIAEVARDLDWGRFIHVSTAYVCGTQKGWVEEKLVPPEQGVHNGYEASKILGEQVVLQTLESRATIVRPSIVVGALGPEWTDSVPVTFAGYYGYFKGFDWLRRQMNPEGGDVDLNDLRIPGDPAAEINLIPLDNLVKMVAALVDNPESDGGVFHAVHPEGPLYQPLVEQSFTVMGIRGGRIVLPDSEEASRDLNPTEHLTRAAVRPFLGYVGEQRRFRTNHMGRFYDMKRVPKIGPAEVRRLLEPALRCRFRTVDRRSRS